MTESKFPVPTEESATLPVKMRSPKKPEFTVATQTPEQLAIQFQVQRSIRIRKIVVMIFLLLPIPALFFFALLAMGPPGLPQSSSFEEQFAKGAIILLPIFWGLDLLFLLIAMYTPLTDFFRIDTPKGLVNLHAIYAFRKKEKNTEILIKDIAGLNEMRFHFKRNQFFILVLELLSGRSIQVYQSGYLQVTHELYDITQKYLPALGIHVNPGAKTSSG